MENTIKNEIMEKLAVRDVFLEITKISQIIHEFVSIINFIQEILAVIQTVFANLRDVTLQDDPEKRKAHALEIFDYYIRFGFVFKFLKIDKIVKECAYQVASEKFGR